MDSETSTAAGKNMIVGTPSSQEKKFTNINTHGSHRIRKHATKPTTSWSMHDIKLDESKDHKRCKHELRLPSQDNNRSTYLYIKHKSTIKEEETKYRGSKKWRNNPWFVRTCQTTIRDNQRSNCKLNAQIEIELLCGNAKNEKPQKTH